MKINDKVNQVELSQDLTDYYRRIRLREFFLGSPPMDPEPFYCKSNWVPPKNRVPSLETYIQVVSSQINPSDHSTHRTHDNLPREEREALKTLRARKDIIVKPADKGLNGVCHIFKKRLLGVLCFLARSRDYQAAVTISHRGFTLCFLAVFDFIVLTVSMARC